MIIARSPLRITLGGGGTDLPSYYRNHEGFLISAAIDKYVYINLIRPFTPGIYLKYSKQEQVKSVEEVKHPIIREALNLLKFKAPQIEISVLADIPARTGLGSSASFTTALLKALYYQQRIYLSQEELAELACHIEIELLNEPVGKQDQYIAAIGGINCLTFHKNDRVTTKPLKASGETVNELEDKLLLFFTGFSRNASSMLKDQDIRSVKQEKVMLENLHYIKELGIRSQSALEQGDLSLFANLMNEHWEFKKRRSVGMSNPLIDEWYALAMQNGALGGKLVGAGSGGFLMFFAEDVDQLRHIMKEVGLEEVRFRFDFEGAKIVLSS